MISSDTIVVIENFNTDYGAAPDTTTKNNVQIGYINHIKLVEAGKYFFKELILSEIRKLNGYDNAPSPRIAE